MIHIDPASADFEKLSRQEQARIYFAMGWTRKALAEEFGVTCSTIYCWLTPEREAIRRAQKKAWLATERGQMLNRERKRRDRQNPERAEAIRECSRRYRQRQKLKARSEQYQRDIAAIRALRAQEMQE